MQNVNRSLDKAGKKMQDVGKKLSVGLTLPIAALGVASINAFDKQAKAIAQVETGLKTTGNAAGFTSEQLQKMASELQNNTLFGDEEILQGATAQLLTFTNIAGEQFGRTQQAALDLATRLDGDLKSASIQLGKALNDPVANLSALSRSGIQFSKEQKATIDALVKTNRLAEAQTIILDELEKQYGGSAAAAAKAGKGSLTQLGNILGDVTEDFGRLILEGIQPFIDKVKSIALSIQGFDDSTKKMIIVIGGFAAALGPAIVLIGTLIRNLAAITPLVKALTVAIAANPIGAFAIAITAVAGGLLLANSRLTPLTDATREFNNLTVKATESIAKEKAEMEKYLSVAKNDKVAKEEREKAIKALNALSPKYLGDLTLEKINTDEATKATEAYTAALLQKAKVQAAEEKLVEVQKKLLDLQTGVSESVNPTIWQNLGNAVKSYGNSAAFALNSADTIAENFNTERTELEKLQAQLLSFIQTNDSLNDSLQDTSKSTITPTVDLDKAKTKGKLTFKEQLEIDLDNAELDKLNQEISDLYNNPDFKLEVAVDEASLQFIDNWISKFSELEEATTGTTDSFAEKMERLAEVGEAVGGTVAGAFEDLSSSVVGSLKLADNGFQGFVKGLVQTITKLIAMMLASSISQAISGATASGSATGPAAVFTTPAFIATAVGGVLAAFAAIPKFETGGIVGGNSFYGDKILARVNSGELILNQKQQASLYSQLDNVQGSQIILNGKWSVSGRELKMVLDREEIMQFRES